MGKDDAVRHLLSLQPCTTLSNRDFVVFCYIHIYQYTNLYYGLDSDLVVFLQIIIGDHYHPESPNHISLYAI